MSYRRFFFLSCCFLFDSLELVSFDELYFFDDNTDNDGYGSGSPGTFAFPFSSGKSVGSAGESLDSGSVIGSGDFFRLKSSQLAMLFRWSCLYQEESILEIVDSYNHFGNQNIDLPLFLS